MAFSREATKKQAEDIKVAYIRCQAKAQHPDIKLAHPAWCKDANLGNYTMLDKTIREQVQKKQVRNERFQKKLHEVGQ